MSVRARKWAWRRVAELPPAAGLVLLRLADLCQDDTCYYTDAQLAEDLGLVRRTLVRARAALVELGLVAVSGGGGQGATTYRLTLAEPCQIVTPEPCQIVTVDRDGMSPSGPTPTVTKSHGKRDKLSPLPCQIVTLAPINEPDQPDNRRSSADASAPPSLLDAEAGSFSTPAEAPPEPPADTQPPADPEPAPDPPKPERQRSAGELRAIAADAILTQLVEDLRALGRTATRQSGHKNAIGHLLRAHGEDRVRQVFAAVDAVDWGGFPFDGRSVGFLVSAAGFDALAALADREPAPVGAAPYDRDPEEPVWHTGYSRAPQTIEDDLAMYARWDAEAAEREERRRNGR